MNPHPNLGTLALRRWVAIAGEDWRAGKVGDKSKAFGGSEQYKLNGKLQLTNPTVAPVRRPSHLSHAHPIMDAVCLNCDSIINKRKRSSIIVCVSSDVLLLLIPAKTLAIIQQIIRSDYA